MKNFKIIIIKYFGFKFHSFSLLKNIKQYLIEYFTVNLKNV